MTTLTEPATARCYECAGGLTCMHCHPIDRPPQTRRIAELEAALRSIYAASDAAIGPDDWGDLVSAAMTDDIRALINDGN